MKILFQGDSITDAFRKPEELNPAFQLGNGYAFLIAAQLSLQSPAGTYEFLNRGVSGNRLSDLATRWPEDTLALRPDLLSLLIGINETIQAMAGKPSLDEAQFAELYHYLLTQLVAANPSTHLVLMEPFLLTVGEVTPDWFHHLKPRQAAIREIANSFSATFIPLQSHFDAASRRFPAAYLVYDGFHPTSAGFQLIAQSWLAATANLFPALPSPIP